MNVTAEQLMQIENALRFYSEGKHFEWSGCHCHGHNVINDRGETADEGLDVIRQIRNQEES